MREVGGGGGEEGGGEKGGGEKGGGEGGGRRGERRGNGEVLREGRGMGEGSRWGKGRTEGKGNISNSCMHRYIPADSLEIGALPCVQLHFFPPSSDKLNLSLQYVRVGSAFHNLVG